MKTKLSYAHCSIYFSGLDGFQMNCPLCGMALKANDPHVCSKEEGDDPKPKRKKLTKDKSGRG